MNKRLTLRGTIPLLLSMVVAVGCTWGMGGEEDLSPMHRNLAKTVDIQTGVVQGDLARAQSAAAWLVDQAADQPFPAEARAYGQEMLRYASLIAGASDLREAAAQTGNLAAACGSCHQAANGGPLFVVGAGSPEGDNREAQMIRHLWAADRMWEGLVGPSEEAWLAGARALAETEPALARAYRESTPAGEVRGFLGEVNAAATDALEATGQEARAEVYGRMLGTCNRCHSAVGNLIQR